MILRVALSVSILCFLSNALIAQDHCTHISDWDKSFYNEMLSAPGVRAAIPEEMPVVIHQMSNYNDGQVMSMVTHLNNYFANNGLPFGFVLCDYIDYDTSIDVSAAAIQVLAEEHNVPNTVNIYVVNSVGSSDAVTVTSDVIASWIGIARFEPSVIAHEMGHYFGLLHTHNTFWGDELVDGSNCATAGDRFCDTPADPNLSGAVDNMCWYIGTETDANGDTYQPDTSNLMSYAYHFCRTSFSEEQKAFMLNTIATKYNDYACGTTSAGTAQGNNALRIYPNPSRGKIVIQLPGKQPATAYALSVYSSTGQEMLRLSNMVDSTLDLSELPNGVYLLKVTDRYSSSSTPIVIH